MAFNESVSLHLRGPLEDLIHRAPVGELFTDLMRVGCRHLRQAHERVHIYAVGEIRGDATCGGVRVIQVPFLFESAHRVADCGGGQCQAEPSGNSSAARRFGGFDVGLDHRFEDLTLALV